MYIAILGRQPELSMAEIESSFGASAVKWFSSESAIIRPSASTDTNLDINRLGGILKAGIISIDAHKSSWQQISQQIVSMYSHKWRHNAGKITLGISAYGLDASPRDIQRIGILIKKNLKEYGTSLRLIPNTEAFLNTATSHHNKLGLSANKVELLIVRSASGMVLLAESTGAQNISALAKRDQGRPRRDAFVGMLPPKLALMMINLAKGTAEPKSDTVRLLDPFCGTGVILQEAALMGYEVYGTDLSEKMIRYCRDNIQWLEHSHRIKTDWFLHEGDAMTTTWSPPIDVVVSETYLGQPFSAPPSPAKLTEVRRNVDHITSTFLKNIHPQLTPGTPLCLAVPAWRGHNGELTHLPITGSLNNIGFEKVKFTHVDSDKLMYFRDDQIVARELLVLRRT